MPGRFNVANALLALALLVRGRGRAADGGGRDRRVPGVPGRMERVVDPAAGRGLVALVDYAHTPDAVAARRCTAAAHRRRRPGRGRGRLRR